MARCITRLLAVLSCSLLPAAALSQFPNIRVSDPESIYPEEVVISINPTDPQNLAAGANLNNYYYSMDGGYTWVESTLTSSFNVWADPCVVFDADGSLYYSHLSYPGVTPGDAYDRIVVQKSIDRGVTFDDGVGVGHNPPKDQDKSWLAVDLTDSRYRNNVYVAWTEFDVLQSSDPADSSRILFSRSTDRGATWSAPVRLSERGGDATDGDGTVEGAVPAVGPNGEVYVSWAGHELIYFDKSLDGGMTFGADVIAATHPGGWKIEIPSIYRCNGFPVTMCDVSNSPYRGHIYILFSDQRAGLDDTDVYIIKSADGGATWSDPIDVIQEQGPHHQFFPWGTIDPVTGFIYVVFYDRRFVGGDSTEVFVATSEDGGATWADFRVSDTPFLTTASVFFGDYIGIAARRGKIHPIWTRMDAGSLSVWTAILTNPRGIDNVPVPPYAQLLQNYPNPFNAATTIEFRLPGPMTATLSVYDVSGAFVVTLADRTYFEGPHQVDWTGKNAKGDHVGSGVYFYRLRAGGETITRKMTYVK
jgi:hypothetical protein